jgi:hypothetical protein
MAQLAGATRAVSDAVFLSGLSTGSLAQKRLKGFPARSFAAKECRKYRGNVRALRVVAVISKAPQPEAEVVPVSLEDSMKVASFFLVQFSSSKKETSSCLFQFIALRSCVKL